MQPSHLFDSKEEMKEIILLVGGFFLFCFIASKVEEYFPTSKYGLPF
jgi:hypothetical protein